MNWQLTPSQCPDKSYKVIFVSVRRLKGEPLPEVEASTCGVEVWAGKTQADLKAEGTQGSESWKEWRESAFHNAMKDCGTDL